MDNPTNGSVCPCCGYCKQCGRSGHQMTYPWAPAPVPWWQQTWPAPLFPYWTTTTGTGVNLTDDGGSHTVSGKVMWINEQT